MINTVNNIYTFLDLAGTFVFALSGAVAAKQKGLDIFGIFSIAFTVACGGGIIRDLCIGAVPPAGLTNWLYLVTVFAATIISIGFYRIVNILNHPVLLFDALGLSVFAVTGARKAIAFGHNYEVAILLGIVTAVGGGVIRDVLLARIPVILKKEIYASAAMAGAMIVVAGDYLGYPKETVSTIAIVFCFGLRFLGLHFHWNLPSFPDKGIKKDE
ncbi:trimeric intracellular cation channel family protein [Segetibacter koreensis]|uniref:trimeric intracellular cation channel family protein n=1 Tax=Segetibacter koreensis TaxID=398037 RepID=UPI000376D3D8|nr:trimeric intracellular cation channel family protein [Segetibacter koreensis]